MSHAFITGTSSGLGLGLARVLLDEGWQVHGISRRGSPITDERFHEVRGDLSALDDVPVLLARLLGTVDRLGLVVLNAGILGQIRALSETALADIQRAMNINVWANKVILDWLVHQHLSVERLLTISSGAAVNGHYGWGAYALSKATLNMLTQLYAAELPQTHLIALAPGLVDTAMQDHLCGEVNADQFPSVRKLIDARGTERMPGPEAAARRIVEVLPRLDAFTSGSFVDVRDL